MKEANFQYKCRQCGTIYTDCSCGTELAHLTLIDVVFDYKNVNQVIGTKPRMIGIHCCKDGGHGVADLIGYTIKNIL